MRVVLFNWLIDVHLKYNLHPQTFFITINIIDSYLSANVVYRNELQLVGITALWIAAKYEETYQVPKISNLVYICDSTYNDKQILEMESKILL
jgi:cyclin B